MVSRRRFNTLLAGTAGWVAAGPLGKAAAQSQPRGAVHASLGARLYRIHRQQRPAHVDRPACGIST